MNVSFQFEIKAEGGSPQCSRSSGELRPLKQQEKQYSQGLIFIWNQSLNNTFLTPCSHIISVLDENLQSLCNI